MKNQIFSQRWQDFSLEEKSLSFLSYQEKAKVWNYSFRDEKKIIPLREENLLISFSRSKEENLEVIEILRWIKSQIFDQNKEQMAPASFASFEKFLREQEKYFYEIHPTIWSREGDFVRAQGWEKKELWGANVVIFYPKRDKARILKTWRKYDSRIVITGEVVDEWSNGKRCLAVVEGSKFCILQNSPKPSYYKENKPLVQPEEAGYKVGKLFAGKDGEIGALYLAEEIPLEKELL